MPETSLPENTVAEAVAHLRVSRHVGSGQDSVETVGRQPVHTVYGGAHLFKADIARKFGDLALRALDEYAPDADTFARAIGIDSALATVVYPRVIDKLRHEPVEDFRIDFEDGYGNRSDRDEDGHAVEAAEQVARGMEANALAPFIGIRIKAFSAELCARSIRTLDIFLTTLARRSSGVLPRNFVVTLPKITSPEQVAVLCTLLETLEHRLGVAPGGLKLEFMIETTASIMDGQGRSMLPQLLEAAHGRCVAAHFGTYDYTASCDITAAHQGMRHPACDFAKHMMKVAYAQTGIWLSDGATNVLPVALHKASSLTKEQVQQNRQSVHAAWRLHADDIRHSLINGFYQGWDLHPAQLLSRYGAVYGFFLDGLAAASDPG